MSNTNKKVYIIIVNYNGWADTIECLESVLRIDYLNHQVIVVDNKSSNNSPEYIKAWAEGKLDIRVIPDNSLRSLSFPPIRKPVDYVFYEREEAEKGGNPKLEKLFKNPLIFIQTGYNGGFAFGNNVAIKYAMAKNDSDYTWLLNNDTVIESNSLSLMIETFENDKLIGIVGSALLIYDKPSLLQVLCGTGKMSCLNAGKGAYIEPKKTYTSEIEKNFNIPGYIVGASMLIRQDVFKQVGLFDENYFMWAEETDFCFRTLKQKYKLYCCGKSKVYHKEGASSGQDEVKSFLFRKSIRVSLKRFVITGYLDRRNHIYFIRKHYGLIYAFFYIFLYMPKLLKTIIGIFLYDSNKNKRLRLLLKGIIDGLRLNMGKPKEI